MDKSFILSEVRRTAIANGGVALGRMRLESETGIKEHHWRKFWARYGELVGEAGFEPNAANEAWPGDELCAASRWFGPRAWEIPYPCRRTRQEDNRSRLPKP